ncbi:YwiC-like family protein [Naumannella sp. ID2617S]|nr:YwiC-like family protein [Naumannella sp. ID2617S]
MSTSVSRSSAVPAVRRGRRSEGWIPRQHGAWAMLLVPSLLAVVATVRRDGLSLHLLPLLACWILGYFAFNSISGWLKVRSTRRRSRYVTPIAAWCILTAASGLVALSQIGWELLIWAGVYTPLITGTLWLVAHHQERSTISGLLTVAAACLMPITILHPNPTELPISASTITLSLLAFGYFFGTVLYVKTLIRHRSEASWLMLSIGWHAVASAVAVVTAAASGLGWAWAVFFDVVLLRAVLVPLLGPMSGRTVTPKQAGIGEIVLSLTFAALALYTLG